MKRKANALSLCLAAALLLGLSQCKKQETPITPPTPEETEEGIHITLDVEDGGKHVVIPGTNTAVVNYSFGDKIYVGDGSKYIGTLTNTGSTGGTSSHFEGIILSPSSETLHFYFVGGLETGTLTKGSTTSFAVDISDQSSNLPVLSYGNAPYRADATSYTCMLENKCALVKVGLIYSTSSVVKLMSNSNIKTQASINFNLSNPLNPSDGLDPITAAEDSETKNITLYSQNGKEKWAILLPTDVIVNNTTVTTVTIGTETYTYGVSVPVLGINNYINSGITIDNHPEFSVSVDNSNETETIKKVMFSKGNLQYQASSSTWRFADNQWDYVGNNDNNNSMSATSGNWMDLFGWGTWTGNNPKPLQISEEAEYTWDNDDFTGELDNHNNWRTLSQGEWNYLLNGRAPNTNARYAKAMVNNVEGLIVFSDNYSQPLEVTPPTNINVYSAPYTGNNYSADEWNTLADYGAVFLPAAGNRTVTTETTTEGEPPTTTIKINEAGNKGYYWTSTTNSHKFVGFDISGVSTSNTTDDPNPTFGCAVRLVRDIE